MPDTRTLPVDITNDEKLARTVFHQFHINKNNKLKSAAFKAPPGRKDVSVNRLIALTANECKKKAKEIESKSQKICQGFAVIEAGKIRELGSEVTDSRDAPNYFGHADIIHDVILKKHQPAPPDFNLRLTKMAGAARLFLDPTPEEEDWNGEDLLSDTPS